MVAIEAKLTLAMLVALTASAGRTQSGSGLPALYTGQEVGAAYEPYATNGPIGWDDPNGLRQWYAGLIVLREREITPPPSGVP